MGQECTTCKACTDQEEIKAETSIITKPIVTKSVDGIVNDKINKTTQKSTNHTVTTAQTNNPNQSPKIQKKNSKSKI